MQGGLGGLGFEGAWVGCWDGWDVRGWGFGGYTGPKNSVGAKDEYGVPDMGLKGFDWVWSV